MGILYIVSTPIGNLDDITLRAISILKEADVIACEDTRKTGLLLSRLKIPKKELFSYYEENEIQRIPQIIQALIQEKNVALVSNAGTPTISDPGYKLVRECINLGIKIEAAPGPSALLTALVSSGLPTDKFLFLGYLPLKTIKRKRIWNLLLNIKKLSLMKTIIIYESPHRLWKTLKEIEENFGNTDIAVCEELTKMFEKIRREKITNSIEYFEKTKPRGEYTLLFQV